MKSCLMKCGNSLAIRIPRILAKEARLKEGDSVELTSGQESLLEIRRVSRVPSLSQLVAQITPENRHPEVQVGKAVGNENSEW
jgi:antitoxin MazE